MSVKEIILFSYKNFKEKFMFIDDFFVVVVCLQDAAEGNLQKDIPV